MSKKILAAFLAVCMIVGLIAVPATAATFDDVAEDHWAASAIERWADVGVLTGHGDGSFAPEDQMTRAQFASMLVKMLGLTKQADLEFDDVDEDAWYAEVIRIAFAAGILTGDNGSARPNDYVSFNEAVVMMARAFGLKPAADAEDQFPDSAAWAKDALNALAALDAISASEDEQINPAMSFDRAAVAAIADKVVTEYVNEDREEPITGEVKGVILVVNNAKVEIKDATLSAPVVVESASVTLTNTKAQDVIVGGKDAAITADEESTVANVTLGGEAPKADIQGEVASVTIAEGATEAVVDAPKAAEDAIVNNSTEEATVNGEAVEGKPEETTEPDEGDENAPGSVSGGGATAPSHAAPVGTREPSSVASEPTDTTGLTAAGDKKLCGSGAEGAAADHSWSKVVTEPTCTAKGSVKYTCGATKTEEIAAPGHSYGRYDYNTSMHWKLCTYCSVVDATSRAAHTWTWANTDPQPEGTPENKTHQTGTCVCTATTTQLINKGGEGDGDDTCTEAADCPATNHKDTCLTKCTEAANCPATNHKTTCLTKCTEAANCPATNHKDTCLTKCTEAADCSAANHKDTCLTKCTNADGCTATNHKDTCPAKGQG